jgi:hypothetical protein
MGEINNVPILLFREPPAHDNEKKIFFLDQSCNEQQTIQTNNPDPDNMSSESEDDPDTVLCRTGSMVPGTRDPGANIGIKANGDGEILDEKLFTIGNLMIIGLMGFVVVYLLIGHIIAMIQYVIESLIFIIMPLKIALHVLSNDSDSVKAPDTTELQELKLAYRQSKKIKKIRTDYQGTLLRQMLVVTGLGFIMQLVPLLKMLPIIGMFSYYIRLLLIILIILVQTPTIILNHIVAWITDKIKFTRCDLHLNSPVSDKIIVYIKNSINGSNRSNGSKLSSIQDIRDIMLKYDRVEFNPDDGKNDGEKLFAALDNLGINTDYLGNIGLDLTNMDTFVKNIKQKIDTIFDTMPGIKALFVEVIKKTNNLLDSISKKNKCSD